MAQLDTSLIKQFVKATDDSSPEKESNRVYGTASVTNTGIFVTPDGSSVAMPVSMATSAENGDRVIVEIVDHQARIIQTVDKSEVDHVASEIVNAQTGVFQNLRVATEYVDTLVAADITAQSITTDHADIGDLKAADVTITGRLDAAEGNITSLTANKANVTDLNAATARIGNLEAADVSLTGRLTAAEGDIDDLEADNVTIHGSLTAAEADIDDLEVGKADIDAANITTASITNAWINKLLVQSGLIASEGSIFYLDAIKVNATSITAGTIDVERIVATDPVTGEKTLVTWNSTTQEWEAAYLDGNAIEDLTITADKIVAGAITADKITTQNIVGTGGWINLRTGTFSYGIPTGDHISWDGTTLTVSGSIDVSKIQAGSITVGKLSPSIQNTLNSADNTFIYDHEYTVSNGVASFTAYLYKGGVDVKTDFSSSQFTWFYKTEDSQTMTSLGTGYTCTVNIANMGYGGHVIGRFVEANDSPLLTEDDDILTDSNDIQLSARTSTGSTVRVSDLTLVTTLYPTDKLMVIGSGQENLISVATLQEYLNANLEKQVLFNTTAGWNAQTSLISEENTIYIYTDYDHDSDNNDVAGIKVGDGLAYVVDLPFTDSVIHERLNDHVSDSTIHVTSTERTFWNNKVRCYYAGTENLVFTTS